MAQREPGGDRGTASGWSNLSRTAAAVRARPREDPIPPAPSRRGPAGVLLGATLILGAIAFSAVRMAASTTSVAADGGLDSQLFSLTNQDRASNGVHALTLSGALQNVGEGAPYHCGGLTVYGRSVDMIQRNYFSHVIPGCGTYVWPMMQAYGVHYRSAGENIGWESGAGSPASYINQAFMNSAEHRANILNSAYTAMGAGSAFGASWSGAGSQQNVWMFSEEFAQLGAAPPPPARPRPTAIVRAAPRNAPAPPAPVQPAAATQPPAPATPTPLPTPTPVPAGLLPVSAYPPPVYTSSGLLPDSIESILEAFLIG
jgi:uncharacterized protein YkwD